MWGFYCGGGRLFWWTNAKCQMLLEVSTPTKVGKFEYSVQ